MSERPEPLKPVQLPKTAAEKAAWGRMKPVQYPDRLGKRIGNRLLSWLTLWK